MYCFRALLKFVQYLNHIDFSVSILVTYMQLIHSKNKLKQITDQMNWNGKP